MIRVWAAIAVLAISWLPGLGYYHLPDGLVWAMAVAAGTVLLLGSKPRMPGPAAAWAATAVLLPVVAIWQWPYRIVPLLLLAGLVLWVLPIPRDWPKRIGEAFVAAGLVLLTQAAALYCYESWTARSHELPWPLPDLLGAVLCLLGQDSAACGNTLALFSMRQVHLLGATWELFLDPATWAFLVGGLVAVGLLAGTRRAGSPPTRWAYRDWLRAGGILILVVLAWLPVRVGILVALYVHRVLVTDYDDPLAVISQFWSTPALLVLLAGPVLLAWRFVGACVWQAPEAAGDTAPASAPSRLPWRRVAAAVAIAGAVAVLTAAVLWDPVGERKAGRVLVEEGHSKWEPTTRPMDTTWYGQESGYNYYCLYDYCSRFYEMGRVTEPIKDSTLADCDVLIIKTPTLAYKDEEIDAICRFVGRGGGLVLIGEHTDVFHIGECLNAITRRFGFAFRYDCLFGVDSVFEERLVPPLVPHPVIQHMPPLDFSVSCSLAPGASPGRAVIRGLGLKNAMADYHASNFYPPAVDRPDMRYGAFEQLWATRQGRGRVVAFTDSTIFSNFSMFEPAKPELLFGMIEWANYQDGIGNPRPWLVAVAAALMLGGLWLARGWPAAGVVLLVSVAMLGHAAAAVAVREHNRQAMPPPPCVRPYTLVTIDRTVSDAVLSKGGFIGGKEEGFGIFERWILRLGYFTRRASAADVARGNLVVVFNPDLRAPPGYAEMLADYVKEGGNLLVLDSRKNAKSTANSLLWPLGLSVKHETNLAGVIAGPAGWPAIKTDSACEVSGGQPLARLQGKPVAACVRHGKGVATVIGFSSRFCDYNMGVTGDILPDAAMREVYEFEFNLLRAIIEGKLADLALPGVPAPPQ